MGTVPKANVSCATTHKQPCTQLHDIYLASASYSDAIRTNEVRSMCCSLFCSLSLLIWQLRLPATHDALTILAPSFFLATSILQYGCWLHAPSSFDQHRKTATLVNSQLGLHCFCTAALLAFQAAPAAHILRASPFAAQLRGACTSLNMLLALSQADIENSAGFSAYLDSSCQEAAEELLTAFVMLYLGLVLPVYSCARSERHHKHLFLQELLLSQWQLQAAALCGVGSPADNGTDGDDTGTQGSQGAACRAKGSLCCGADCGSDCGSDHRTNGVTDARAGTGKGVDCGSEGLRGPRGLEALEEAHMFDWDVAPLFGALDAWMALLLAGATWAAVVHCKWVVLVMRVPI